MYIVRVQQAFIVPNQLERAKQKTENFILLLINLLLYLYILFIMIYYD